MPGDRARAARASAFHHRGVVEGFYGRPWSHADRLWLVERLGAWGMNRYVHAPKDDPHHRERWREPHPADAVREFAKLVERGAAVGVDVGFALSPGLSIRYSARADRAALVRRFRDFRDLGARFFGLALDDVPSRLVHDEDRRGFASLAQAHAALAHDVGEAVGPGATLWLVPTDYLGVEPTDYLEELGERLDAAVEVAWTGRTVVSPTVVADEAAARAATLRRPPLLWDNVPVSDGPMRRMLHLGPYAGRDPGLAQHASGVLLNPMERARASALALYTAARYLADPVGYDAESAWRDAAEELGAGAPRAFALFARAHRFSALAPADRDAELEAGLERLRAARRAGAPAGPELAALADAVRERAGVAEALRASLADRGLLAEIEPWIESHAAETRRIETALAFAQVFFGEAPRRDRTLAFFAMQGRLTQQPLPLAASYGPRRVLYPQLASMRDEHMGFGRDRALFRDRCLADEFVAFAEELALEGLRT